MYLLASAAGELHRRHLYRLSRVTAVVSVTVSYCYYLVAQTVSSEPTAAPAAALIVLERYCVKESHAHVWSIDD